MVCACDSHVCGTRTIAAGLNALPRALGTFPYWRSNVLAAIAREGALVGWRAREAGDFGVMLAEMFAYLGDVTSFYDALVANETYLGTATVSGSARRLVALLGYQPRPALAASVWLAAEADGVRLLTLPAVTAFRSGEFDGNPPQIFESTGDVIVEPRVNRLAVDRVPATTLPSPLPGIDVPSSTLRARVGQALVVATGATLAAVRVASLEPRILRTGRAVTYIGFDAPAVPPAGARYAETRLLSSGARCGAWKLTPASGESAVISGAELSLDGRVPVAAGDVVAIEASGTIVARRVTSASETSYTLLAGLESTLTDPNGKVSTLASPSIKTAVTRLMLDQSLPFGTSSIGGLNVHYAMSDAGTVHAPLKDTLAQTDPVHVPGLLDPPRAPVTQLAFEDAHGEAVVAAGIMDAVARSATPDSTPGWGRELAQPVLLNGNAFLAMRGESVARETLGAGDAAQPSQRFRLKKKPLTYVPAANIAGRVSTLVIRVGGILWAEVASFYGQPADAMVYVVRHDEQGETDVEIGGAGRPPTGAPIVASYRFGGGAAVPPAGSVKQVARPVVGLRGARNPLAAFGGADAEGPLEVASRGPGSALLLGRVVSLIDFETAALERSGVRAARAAWRWDEQGQRPAVVLRYLGDAQLAPSIRAALRALAEEDAPIAVLVSPAQPARLDVEIETDPRLDGDMVADAVGQALFARVSPPDRGGLLRGERLGPDGVVFASAVIQAIMAVDGVTGLSALSFDDTPFIDTGRVPAAGSWFDFAAGGVRVNGRLAG